MTDDKRMFVRVADWKAQPGYVPGDDPDSFIRREGPDAFQHLIDTAKPYGDWIIDGTFADLDEKDDIYVVAQVVKGLVEMAHREPDPIIRAHYLRRIASMAQVDEAVLMAPIALGPAPTYVTNEPPRPVGPRPSNVIPIYERPEYRGMDSAV